LSIKFVAQACFVLLIAALFFLPLAAQQAPPPADPAPPAQADTANKPAPAQDPAPPQASTNKNDSDKDKGAQGKNSGTSNDRLFYTLPNFLTMENTRQLPPLTTAEKFKVVARGSFDYVQYPWYGFLAGISQAENSEPGYGQGAKGYGKRFASAFADGTIENFFTGAILPSLLREDPRFYQSGQGSFTRRTGYAVSRIFVTRTDSGGTQFNYSEIVGSALSAAVSTYSYHPKSFITYRYPNGVPMPVFNGSDRTLKNTASVWGSQVGYDTITIVVKEFWPDVHRKLSKRHKAVALESDKPAEVK